MRVVRFIACIGFLCFASKAGAQIYQQSMQERAQPKTYEEFLVNEIRTLPEVKKKEDYIIYQSTSMKMAVFLVEGQGQGIYTVKVIEDNGTKNQVVHLKYTVDSATGKILNTERKK